MNARPFAPYILALVVAVFLLVACVRPILDVVRQADAWLARRRRRLAPAVPGPRRLLLEVAKAYRFGVCAIRRDKSVVELHASSLTWIGRDLVVRRSVVAGRASLLDDVTAGPRTAKKGPATDGHYWEEGWYELQVQLRDGGQGVIREWTLSFRDLNECHFDNLDTLVEATATESVRLASVTCEPCDRLVGIGTPATPIPPLAPQLEGRGLDA